MNSLNSDQIGEMIEDMRENWREMQSELNDLMGVPIFQMVWGVVAGEKRRRLRVAIANVEVQIKEAEEIRAIKKAEEIGAQIQHEGMASEQVPLEDALSESSSHQRRKKRKTKKRVRTKKKRTKTKRKRRTNR